MRFLVIAVAIVAGSSQVVGQPDWVPEQTGVSTTFNSVHFGDAFFGYAVGDSGIIAFANSQGGTWTPVSFGDSIVFHDVSTIFSVYIWVVGSDGLIGIVSKLVEF